MPATSHLFLVIRYEFILPSDIPDARQANALYNSDFTTPYRSLRPLNQQAAMPRAQEESFLYYHTREW